MYIKDLGHCSDLKFLLQIAPQDSGGDAIDCECLCFNSCSLDKNIFLSYFSRCSLYLSHALSYLSFNIYFLQIRGMAFI